MYYGNVDFSGGALGLHKHGGQDVNPENVKPQLVRSQHPSNLTQPRKIPQIYRALSKTKFEFWVWGDYEMAEVQPDAHLQVGNAWGPKWNHFKLRKFGNKIKQTWLNDSKSNGVGGAEHVTHMP